MKVLQINSVCGIRSTGRICTDIADILQQQGHDCKIAYGRCEVPEKYQKYAVKIGSDFDVNCHAIMSRIFDNAGFKSKKVTEKFIKWIKKYDPDIIHLHNIHGYYINIEILFRYLAEADKPVIWTLHDCWAFTGHCSYFSASGCEKWKTGCEHCQLKKEYPTSNVCDRSRINWAKKSELFTSVKNMNIITPSEWLADLVKKSYLGKYPVSVINNGIDLDIFKPTKSDFRKKNCLQDKKIILGVASIWDARKGFDDFIKLSKVIDDSYRIVLVGLAEDQIKMLSDNMLGITKTNSTKELAEIYTAADVFVNFTYEDNYPTVNLEAQACGTPVITYNTGGSVESVPDENIIEQGDIKAFLNMASYKFFDNQSIIEKFDKKNKFKEYLDLYQIL